MLGGIVLFSKANTALIKLARPAEPSQCPIFGYYHTPVQSWPYWLSRTRENSVSRWSGSKEKGFRESSNLNRTDINSICAENLANCGCFDWVSN